MAASPTVLRTETLVVSPPEHPGIAKVHVPHSTRVIALYSLQGCVSEHSTGRKLASLYQRSYQDLPIQVCVQLDN
jgi:hypothetical protein